MSEGSMKTDDNNSHFPWLRATWTVLILVLVTLYWRTLNAPFIYDDKIEVIGNRSIRSISEWESVVNYNPSRVLLQLTYAFNLNESALNPWHGLCDKPRDLYTGSGCRTVASDGAKSTQRTALCQHGSLLLERLSGPFTPWQQKA